MNTPEDYEKEAENIAVILARGFVGDAEADRVRRIKDGLLRYGSRVRAAAIAEAFYAAQKAVGIGYNQVEMRAMDNDKMRWARGYNQGKEDAIMNINLAAKAAQSKAAP